MSFLLFLSFLTIAAGVAARWWFGARILDAEGERPCRCDLSRWLPAPGDSADVHRAQASAAEFGRQLRLKALHQWKTEAPRAVRSRERSRTFGQAVPPLSAMIAILAMIAGRVPFSVALVILFGATALATASNLLSLPTELAAISRAIRQARDEFPFPNRDDHDAISRCALALAWTHSLPPILRWIHR